MKNKVDVTTEEFAAVVRALQDSQLSVAGRFTPEAIREVLNISESESVAPLVQNGILRVHNGQFEFGNEVVAAAMKPELKQSWAEAKEQVRAILGPEAVLARANNVNGVNHGEIIAETKMHVVQQVYKLGAVTHMKHSLDAVPPVGDSVLIEYNGYKGKVTPMEQKEKHKQGLAIGLTA